MIGKGMQGFFGQCSAKFLTAGCWCPSVLPDQPPLQNLDYTIDIPFCERFTPWDVMPVLQALATACAGGVLSDKDRMVPHRCLTPVVGRISVGQSLRDEITSMLDDRLQSLLPQVIRVFA